MGRGWAIIAVLAGCARITAREYRTDTPVAPSVRDAPIADSLVYRAKVAVQGPLLHVEIAQAETCVEVTTERVHRMTRIERHADPTITGTTWLVAALGVGGGIAGYAQADALATQNGTTPDAIRQTAIGMAVLGLAATAIGFVDLSRARDEQRDDGLIAGASRRREYACKQHRTGGVELVVAGIGAPLDGTGAADVDLSSLAENVFDDALTATIEGKELALPLAPTQRRALVLAISLQPQSRIAQDRLAKHRAQCDAAIARARALTPEPPEEISSAAPVAWTSAHDACDELWTSALTSEVAVVDARIVEARCKARMTRVAFALAETEEPADAADLASELGQLRVECPALPHLDDAERKVASLVARRAQAAAREERARSQVEAQARREELRRARAQAASQRSWGDAPLLCNDGSLSPSCTCGGNRQGCCSHHHGVAGCSQ